MKKTSEVLIGILCFLLITLDIKGQDTNQWHYPLYLSNMGYWHSRIPVVVTNSSEQDVSGESVGIVIGKGGNQLNLTGAAAEGVRVVDSRGIELLYRVTSPNEELVTEGVIPDKSEFLLPATVKAGMSETYYIYFDNPAAWSIGAILESHSKVINSGFENGEKAVAFGWKFGTPNEEPAVSRCHEYPHSGEYCLQIVNRKEKPKDRDMVKQYGIFIRGGTKYRVEGWVKANEVDGKAGWQILLGSVPSDDRNFMKQKLFLDGGGGTYGWKRVSSEFTVPQNTNSARIYPILEGKGIAWYDDIQITCITKDILNTDIKPAETITLNKEGENEVWPDEKIWNIRVPIKVFNFSNNTREGLPVYVNVEQILLRLHDKVDQFTKMKLGNKTIKQYFRFENALLLDCPASSLSEQTYYVYFTEKIKNPEVRNSKIDFSAWYNDKRNLVKNPGIAQGETNWIRLKSGELQKEDVQGISDKGNSDKVSLKIHLPDNKKPVEIGWTQNIPVVSGHTYMFGAMVRCDKLTAGSSIKILFCGANGSLSKRQASSGKISGNEDWKFISGVFKAPEDITEAVMYLTLAESGTVWFKGMLIMEVVEGYSSSMFFDQREKKEPDLLAAWPVNSIIKVFLEDQPPEQILPTRISVAANETEPLQIAIRSRKDCKSMRVEVTLPENSAGKKLDKVTTNVIGYVPVDYPSNYYEKKVPYWYLKYPDEAIGSDGWSGYWPDPLLPRETFDLSANSTQPVWIEVEVPEGTKSGDYSGKINLFQNDSLVKVIPLTVHVWDFTLPQKNSFGAIYDMRSPQNMPEPIPDLSQTDLPPAGLRNMYVSFMAKHRISSGEINPLPRVNYQNGKVNIDFTEYDKAAAYYFDELKNPFAYLPTSIFYLFGWAFPPSDKFREKPYTGDYPYEGADRSKLRPEYKKAYQLVLKTFWDHLKEKGWADRYILYLSDEPHEADNNKDKSNDIRIQMKALCDMIHEVDRKIPVYASTWWYRPEWKGYIDVWGLGFNGEGDYGHYVTAEDMQQITRSGGRIWYTTDGNFCTETPYLALERLLPWFGYKYGAETYEFWGVNWLTYNPFKYGWHSYIFESQAPGEESWKRYPNGDGFIIYPGKPIGEDGLIGSIRLKQVREGAEDYEYLSMLGNLIKKADPGNPALTAARQALQQALDIINIPCAMGRYSTKILKTPDELLRVRKQVAESIEKLINK